MRHHLRQYKILLFVLSKENRQLGHRVTQGFSRSLTEFFNVGKRVNKSKIKLFVKSKT